MKQKLILITTLAIILFSLSFIVSAELSLEIDATLNHHDTTFYARTDPSSDTGLDSYDTRFPAGDFPGNWSKLVSTVSGVELLADYWDATNTWSNTRTMNLTYEVSSENEGQLTFTWDSDDFGEQYTGTLYDYSYNDDYSGIPVETNMNNNEVYEVSQSAIQTKRYLQLEITYLQYYNGDGICNASLGETCSNAVADCGACPGTTTPGGGGGGGASTTIISMDLVMPAPIALAEEGLVEIPLTLKNNGTETLNNIDLTSLIEIDGEPSDLRGSFDKSAFASLTSGNEEEITYSFRITDSDPHVYEVIINATSKTPSYSIQDSVFLNFVGKEASGILNTIVFTEGMISENAECYELRDMIAEARQLLVDGNTAEALALAQKALDACKQATEGPKQAGYFEREESKIVIYLLIGLGLAVLLGVAFNVYRLLRFKYLSKRRRHSHKNKN